MSQAGKRNARRVAASGGAKAGPVFDAQSRAAAGAKRVKINAPERGSRSLVAKRSTAAANYAGAVASRRSAIGSIKADGKGFNAKRKAGLRQATAAQLSKATATAKANPNSSAAKEALALSRMAAAVGGSHPKQRIRVRRRK